MLLSLINAPTIFLAQVSPGAPAPAVSEVQMANLWDFIVKGGPVMIIIGLCSLVALAIIIERSIVLRRGRVVPKDFVNQVRAAANDRARALELCRANSSPISRAFEAALKNANTSIDHQDRLVEETGQRELVALRHRMRLLSAMPQVATLLGLLGTIFGMIKTFQVVAVTGQALGKTEQLAKGIFEAWTCTAAGLAVAIVVLILYHVLMGRIDALTAQLDRTAADFLELLRSGKKSAVPLVAAGATPNGQSSSEPTMSESNELPVAATA